MARRVKRGPPRSERSQRMIKLYRSGRSPMQIARELACSGPLVYSVLRRASLWHPRRRRVALNGADTVLRRLRRAGFSVSLLARVLGVSTVAVRKALRGPTRRKGANRPPSRRTAPVRSPGWESPADAAPAA